MINFDLKLKSRLKISLWTPLNEFEISYSSAKKLADIRGRFDEEFKFVN